MQNDLALRLTPSGGGFVTPARLRARTRLRFIMKRCRGRCGLIPRERAEQGFCGRGAWARRESNPHARRPQGLSPLCLPFHHAPRLAVCHSGAGVRTRAGRRILARRRAKGRERVSA